MSQLFGDGSLKAHCSEAMFAGKRPVKELKGLMSGPGALRWPGSAVELSQRAVLCDTADTV